MNAKEFTTMIARLQMDGEGECNEHGFVDARVIQTAKGLTKFLCPECLEEVEVFDLTNDDAHETLHIAIHRARNIVKEFN